MKKALVVVLALLIIAAVFTFFIYIKINGDPLEHSRLQKAVKQYLTVEKGYATADIQTITTRYVAPNYFVEVVFQDEPDTVYLYCEREEMIEQCGIEGEAQNAKHKE